MQELPIIPTNLDWLRSRKTNYQDMSENDIGHIYDMIQTIVDHLQIDLKANDKAILDHRKAIKAAFPKD
jgi:hypothetical protein